MSCLCVSVKPKSVNCAINFLDVNVSMMDYRLHWNCLAKEVANIWMSTTMDYRKQLWKGLNEFLTTTQEITKTFTYSFFYQKIVCVVLPAEPDYCVTTSDFLENSCENSTIKASCTALKILYIHKYSIYISILMYTSTYYTKQFVVI